MKLALLGVGGAGGRVVERMVGTESDERPYIAGYEVFDTDSGALARLDLPEGVGQQIGAHGADIERGEAVGPRTAAEENARELRRAATDAVTASADAVLVVGGLGGATAAGAAPVIVDTVREVTDLPVYALSILPSADEEAPAPANTAAGLRGLEATVDTQFVFDNERRSKVSDRPADEDAADVYDGVNGEIARWLTVLFGAGEASADGTVGESVVDASEIIATLGDRGYTMLGHERQQVLEEPSLLDRLLSRTEAVDEIESYSTIETAVRRALLRHRSFDADLTHTERSLLVTMGPPDWLNREAIADSRGVIAQETNRSLVRGGDTPVDGGTHLTVLVVCAGLPRHGRIAEYLS